MRKLLLAALAMTVASPAFASPTSEEIVSALPHPFDVEEAGEKLGGAVGAILNVPIGGVVRAIDPTARIDPRATVGEIAGRDDPDFEGRMQDEVAGISTKAADMVRGLAAAAPALQRSIAQLERELGRALGGLGR